jgi:hypothetical protein
VELLESSTEEDDEDATAATDHLREPASSTKVDECSTSSAATPHQSRSVDELAELFAEAKVEDALQGEEEAVDEYGIPPGTGSAASQTLQRAQDSAREGMPRRSLQALLGLLKGDAEGGSYRDLDPSEKIALHRAIAGAAAETGLVLAPP